MRKEKDNKMFPVKLTNHNQIRKKREKEKRNKNDKKYTIEKE